MTDEPLHTYEELMAMVPADLRTKRDRFGAKLTREQIGQIIALNHLGFSKRFLGHHFGVNQGTVSAMTLPHKPAYRSYKLDYTKDPAAFIQSHLTPELIHSVKEAQDKYLTIEEKPNARANQWALVYDLKGADVEQVSIRWVADDPELNAGWFVCDAEGPRAGPFITSREAFTHVCDGMKPSQITVGGHSIRKLTNSA